MTDKKRKKRIEELIRRELGKVLITYPRHPLFIKVTIVDADVSPDLANCKVFFSVFDPQDAKQAVEALKNESVFLRKMLARNLNLRLTPRLNFIYDETTVKAQKLSDLIDSAIAEDEKSHC